MSKLEINEITGLIIKAALKVHTILGPGLFEQVYQRSLAIELRAENLQVETEVSVPVQYDCHTIGCRYLWERYMQNCTLNPLPE